MNDHVLQIRRSITDPAWLCDRLGLLNGAKRQTRGVLICCPAHGDRTPSCSVMIAQDGTIGVKCFGCDFSGDALSLIATVHGLDLSSDFKEVLLVSAELAGLSQVVDEINGHKPYAPRPLPPAPEPLPQRAYPPAEEVLELWATSCAPNADGAATVSLADRAIECSVVSQLDLARVIMLDHPSPLPRWATFQGKSWITTGHRLIIPMFDHAGERKSVRAWKLVKSDTPKRLPPAGYRATGLIMANGRARDLLTKKSGPCQILITEGEPDFVVAGTRWPWIPVFGIVNGSWCPEFAARVPMGSEVVVMTHHDTAGDIYAENIKLTVKSRAVVLRSEA